MDEYRALHIIRNNDFSPSFPAHSGQAGSNSQVVPGLRICCGSSSSSIGFCTKSARVWAHDSRLSLTQIMPMPAVAGCRALCKREGFDL